MYIACGISFISTLFLFLWLVVCYVHVNVHVHVLPLSGKSTDLEKQSCGFESHLGQLTFSLKRRESELSQVVLLCCLALFNVPQLFNHVHE